MNCPVLPEDIDNSQSIYGPSLHCLKGKTVRSSPIRVRKNVIPVPPFILERNKKITLEYDFMYINNITFLSQLVRIFVSLQLSTSLIYYLIQYSSL